MRLAKCCQTHERGRVPGMPVKYDPTCVECVRRRGHLPEGERDIPGEAKHKRRFSPYLPDRHSPQAKARAIKARRAVVTVWGD